MPKDRKGPWITALAVAAGVIATIGFGFYSFFSAFWTPLHSNPQEIPSITDGAPAKAWTRAIERARKDARDGLIEKNLPGLSVAVGVDGEIVWAEGVGWADLDARVPVTPRMRFRIGHVSKAITSAGAGRLVEQGRMDLDAEIQTYVPAFPRKEWPVTVRQLMGHMGGVRHYESEEDYMPTSGCGRASDGLQRFMEDPLLFEPETRSQYSTFGWILVSAAIEAVAGEPFQVYMRRQVFEPLAMTDTTFDSGAGPIPNRVVFYSPRFSGDPGSGPEPAAAVDYSCFAGAGAILSTPSDLVRFGLGLGTGTLLKRSTVTKLQTPVLLASGKETEFGLGWMVHNVPLGGETTREAGHASLTLLGSSTSFLTFPDRGIVVAVMANISRANTRSIALRIAEAFAAR